MSEGAISLLQRWSAADWLATDAEQLVAEKAEDYALCKGSPPTPEEIALARGLRQKAKSLLALMLDDLQEQQAMARWRGPAGGSSSNPSSSSTD